MYASAVAQKTVGQSPTGQCSSHGTPAHGDRLDLDQRFGTLAQSQFLVELEENRVALPPKHLIQRGLSADGERNSRKTAPAPPARPGYSFPGDPLKREDAIACARLLWPDVRYTDAFRKSKA